MGLVLGMMNTKYGDIPKEKECNTNYKKQVYSQQEEHNARDKRHWTNKGPVNLEDEMWEAYSQLF